MAVRYYPSFAINEDLTTDGNEFSLDGEIYTGKYYQTSNGRFFTGPNPIIGPNEELKPLKVYNSAPGLAKVNLTDPQIEDLAQKAGGETISRIPGKPNYHYPEPTDQDYQRGYVIRYFTKKENETIVIEISEEEYNSIVNGTADYDISIYQTTKILWKITGPLRSQRQSQYNIIPGIIDTNQRLTEAANKNFLGIKNYIGEDYAKFSRPTA